MKAVAKRPHTDGKGLARFDRKVEKPVAKPDYAGRTLGNMTGGRSRRASEPTHTGRTGADSQCEPVLIGARARRDHVRLRCPAARKETGA